MRRLRIIFYWIFHCKNNINIVELTKFLLKPRVDKIAKQYIKEVILHNNFFEITFTSISKKLFWPKKFKVDGIYQVTTETFDTEDWHYYQYKNTEVVHGEIVLDIGTAEGLFPLVVIDKCEHIYMVEPSKVFCEALEKTFLNFSEKTTVFNTAVGSIDDEVYFNEDSLAGQISENELDGAKIQLAKIDTIMKDKRITFLKADIEGFEQEMLLGAEKTIKNNKPKIAITSYHKENNPNEIIELIKSYVPEYNYFVKGIHGEEPKPVMIHFWL
jgi:FkbM family methyltransferase